MPLTAATRVRRIHPRLRRQRTTLHELSHQNGNIAAEPEVLPFIPPRIYPVTTTVPAIDSETARSVKSLLAAVESAEDVRICLAVESGSRAWGFPSADSDYDVRFIYVHRPEWYLSIDEGRDVIERPLIGTIDLSGWDIRKSLKLFRKSNPPLLEWLQSPFVYAESGSLATRMREMLPRFYDPNASFFHYLHMAQGNLREYLSGDVVWQKKYLYVLRPLLAMRWIEQERGAVPMEFDRIVKETRLDPETQSAIRDLVDRKTSGAELDRGPRIPALNAFIATEMARFATLEHQHRGRDLPQTAELNALFQETLRETWTE